jgi:hypothetical protein
MTRQNPLDKWIAYFKRHRFLLIGCGLLFIGYSVGKDIALRDNARDQADRAGQQAETNP